MLEHVAAFFGASGLDVQLGSTVVEGTEPELAEELEVHGTLLRVGALVQQRTAEKGREPGAWSGPRLVRRLIPGEPVQVQTFDAADPDGVFGWPLAAFVVGPGWRREYRFLSQEEIDAWWEARRPRTPGWHPVRAQTWEPTRVLIDDAGRPVEIDRVVTSRAVEESRREAEVFLGMDVEIEARYRDEEKLRRRVKVARVRPAPRQVRLSGPAGGDSR